MRLHRFYITEKIGLPALRREQAGERKEITLTDPELIHQLLNVFRFQAGNKVILFDGTGYEYEAEIILINKKEIKLNIIKALKKEIINKNVSLYLSLIKKSNFELAVEKCTEIGVSEIQPIISERSEKKDLNIERLNKIVKEASEQSGRTTLPRVFDIISLQLAVSQVLKEGKEGVVFHTVTDSSTAPSPSLSNEGESPKEVVVFVGPEGGFTEDEINLFKQNNFKILSLGQNILRAETAAMVAVWEGLKM